MLQDLVTKGGPQRVEGPFTCGGTCLTKGRGVPRELHPPFLAGWCSRLSRAGWFCPIVQPSSAPPSPADGSCGSSGGDDQERGEGLKLISSLEYCPDELRSSRNIEGCDI